MAIRFARTAYVSRSDGGNACLKAAYNLRGRVECERTGEVFYFKHRGGNAHHEILIPEGVDQKFKNSSYLWNSVEKTEKRINSQLSKELVIALPDNKEVTLDIKIELTRRFVETHFVSKGLAAQFDIHEPHVNERNWHAHVLVTTRRFSKDGLSFGEKARDLNQEIRKGYVTEGWNVGKSWEDFQNEFFKEKGLDIKVDPIGIVPQVHIGPVRMRQHMSSALERAELLREANEEAVRDPDQILKKLTHGNAVFTEKDLDQFLLKHVDSEDIEKVRGEALNHKELIPLFDSTTGEKTPYLTTKNVREVEEKCLRFATKIKATNGKSVQESFISKTVQTKTLSEEQATILKEATNKSVGLTIVEGRAGTGKSHTMNAICEVYEKSGYRVIGAAPTNSVTQDMQKSGFSEAHTVHSLLFKHKNNRMSLDAKTVLVIDEAAMLNTSALVELLHVAHENKARLVLFGDDHQLSSVERGGMFSVLKEELGSCSLTEVRRQNISWQKQVSEHLGVGEIRQAVTALDQNGAIDWQGTKQVSLDALVRAWTVDSEADQSLENRLVLANKNVDVDTLNKAIRDIRLAQGEIGSVGYECQTKRGREVFSTNDRILFTDSAKELGITNGAFGRILEIKEDKCIVELDAGKEQGRAVTFDPQTYHGMKLGYAATIYKSQGKTLDKVYLLHDKSTNRSLSYVGLSRQTNDLKVFVNKEETTSLSHLISQMDRNPEKGSSLKFSTAEQIQRKKWENETYLDAAKSLWSDLKKAVKTTLSDTFHKNEAFYQVPKKPDVGKVEVKQVVEVAEKREERGLSKGHDQKLKHALQKRAEYELEHEKRYVNACKSMYFPKEMGRSPTAYDQPLIEGMAERLKSIEGRIFQDLLLKKGKAPHPHEVAQLGRTEFMQRQDQEKLLKDQLKSTHNLSEGISKAASQFIQIYQEKHGHAPDADWQHNAIKLSEYQMSRLEELSGQGDPRTEGQRHREQVLQESQVNHEVKHLQQHYDRNGSFPSELKIKEIQKAALETRQQQEITLKQQRIQQLQQQRDINLSNSMRL